MSARPKLLAMILLLPALASCQHKSGPPASAAGALTKPVSFAILEDYDKGEDLAAIEQDFMLMRQLEIDTLRCSFGWDDYEPEPGKYDFAWLREFASLAFKHNITIRPYIAYTPQWAGVKGADDLDWNNAPARLEQWREFVFRLATELRQFPNVVSYEIYNEQNAPFWWDGTIEQYIETLNTASGAIRAANPRAEVILGGFVFPDENWLRPIVASGAAQSYDITAFHAYPETWTEPGVTAENYLDEQYQRFVQLNRSPGENEPIWINEMGFATVVGVSESQQANWFARAISTYLADPHIGHIGVYELKDLRPESAALGDAKNYHLGITRTDRTPKLAFHTVDLITDLLDTGTLTVADGEASIEVVSGSAGELHHHLFRRPDEKQVLFVWDKTASPTLNVRLRQGRSALRCGLDGKVTAQSFTNQALQKYTLLQGEVGIFLIELWIGIAGI